MSNDIEKENQKTEAITAAATKYNTVEFKSAKQIDDANKEDCSRCIRLGKEKPGKIEFPRSYFCEWCLAQMMIGSGEV
jgi:hypothetical protein